MKRDFELLRRILLDIEAAPAAHPIREFEYEEKSQPEILAHVKLLHDAGFIEGIVVPDHQNQPRACIISGMTWEGYEFLGRAKNDTVWKKVMAQAEEKGMSTSFAVINGLLEAAAKKYAGLR